MVCEKPSKVAIVGVGHVGSTIAYSLMLDGTVRELALIDRDKNKVKGELLDLQHGMQFASLVSITGGDSFGYLKNADVVIVTAGFAQKQGETRANLLERNVEVFKEIIPQIVHHNKDCILLVVTNPLDVLTYTAWKLSRFDTCRVFGTGTVLDTSRLRYLLGKYFSVSPKDITAYVLGEHGDTEFAWWSRSHIAGSSLDSLGLTVQMKEEFLTQVRRAAYEVIAHKGATYYAIALVVSKIVRAILLDQSRVFTLSTVLQNYKNIAMACMSVPTVVRRSGVCQRLTVDFSEDEEIAFQKSYQKINVGLQRAESLL